MKNTFYGWHMSWRIHFMDDICHEEYILWMTYVMEDTFYEWHMSGGYILWMILLMDDTLCMNDKNRK